LSWRFVRKGVFFKKGEDLWALLGEGVDKVDKPSW
jgi:hypothetical protein